MLGPYHPAMMASVHQRGIDPSRGTSQHDSARSPSPDSARHKKRHTPRAIIEQMNDISGTITELMHENVYLRTKLLNAKSPYWKRLFLGCFEPDYVFAQWAIVAKQSKKDAFLAEYERRMEALTTGHEQAVEKLHSDHSDAVKSRDYKLDDVSKERDGLKTDLERCERQIQRFMKYFNVMQEQIRDASDEYLGITDADLTKARSKYVVQVEEYLPATDEEKQNMVNEFLLENMHMMLSQVDGRYVRPLNTKLPPRAMKLPTSTRPSQTAPSMTLTPLPPSEGNKLLPGAAPPSTSQRPPAVGWQYKSLTSTPLLNSRLDSLNSNEVKPILNFQGMHTSIAPFSTRGFGAYGTLQPGSSSAVAVLGNNSASSSSSLGVGSSRSSPDDAAPIHNYSSVPATTLNLSSVPSAGICDQHSRIHGAGVAE